MIDFQSNETTFYEVDLEEGESFGPIEIEVEEYSIDFGFSYFAYADENLESKVCGHPHLFIPIDCPCYFNIIGAYQEDNWSSQIITSSENSLLCIEFYTYNIPDQIQLFINGIQAFNSGVYSSDGHGGGVDCDPLEPQGILEETFLIQEGDQIQLFVTAGPAINETCYSNSNYWNLSAVCSQLCGRKTKKEIYEFSYGSGYKSESLLKDEYALQNVTPTIKVYPNPAEDEISINFGMNDGVVIKTLEIKDINGKSFAKRKVQNSRMLNLNISNYPSGIYLVVLMDINENRIIHRFVKQ